MMEDSTEPHSNSISSPDNQSEEESSEESHDDVTEDRAEDELDNRSVQMMKDFENLDIIKLHTAKDADCYHFRTDGIKLALIVTEKTEASIGYDQMSRFKSVIKDKFGFQVQTFINLTTDEIKDHVRNELKKKNIDALIFMIFTSSTEEGEVRVENGVCKLSDLWEIFSAKNYPNLIGKPKMFFVVTSCTPRANSNNSYSTCQSNNNKPTRAKEGGDMDIPPNQSNNNSLEEGEIYTIPTYADFVTYYTTNDNIVEEKSIFIEAFCDQMEDKSTRKLKELKLSTIMTFIAQRYNYYLGGNESNKGLMNMSTLTREVVFSSTSESTNN